MIAIWIDQDGVTWLGPVECALWNTGTEYPCTKDGK